MKTKDQIKLMLMHPKKWCPYCPQDSVSCKKVSESKNIIFEDIDLDEKPEYGLKFKIEMLPAILFTCGKRELLVQGASTEETIRELLEEFKKGS
jgi:thiol-disulfide isomerase/thioredoxin